MQELKLQRIKDANQKRYEEGCAELELAPSVPPERRSAIRLSKNHCPFLTRDSFAKVEAESSRGKNRPHGYGYTTASHGFGGAALYDVRYTPAYDGGCTH